MFCALCADCMTVDSRTFEIALSSIWPKIREHEVRNFLAFLRGVS